MALAITVKFANPGKCIEAIHSLRRVHIPAGLLEAYTSDGPLTATAILMLNEDNAPRLSDLMDKEAWEVIERINTKSHSGAPTTQARDPQT